MNIAVIGTGYVGLVTGACLAEMGHQVICADTNSQKINGLKKGVMPIYEPGLEEMIKHNVEKKRLHFTTNSNQAITDSEIIFCAVGTPTGKTEAVDLSAVYAVADLFGKNLNTYKVFVNKSTVPVGTSKKINNHIKENLKNGKEFDVVDNPEFLREGSAIEDFMVPDRIIVGAANKRSRDLMQKVYNPLVRAGRPLIFTDINSAETIKYAANAFLAMKVSFINDMANFCERVGADIKEVAQGIGLDQRIGSRYLHAGIGYGGSCFPKDVQALIETGKEYGHQFEILKAVESVNRQQKTILIEKMLKKYKTLTGLTIGIWGLAFKPKTDDMRQAPSIPIISLLSEQGVKAIHAYDPAAMKNAKTLFKNEKKLRFCANAFEALRNADALLILTEWDEFRAIDLQQLKKEMQGNDIFDGRNLYEHDDMKTAGLNYYCIGR